MAQEEDAKEHPEEKYFKSEIAQVFNVAASEQLTKIQDSLIIKYIRLQNQKALDKKEFQSMLNDVLKEETETANNKPERIDAIKLLSKYSDKLFDHIYQSSITAQNANDKDKEKKKEETPRVSMANIKHYVTTHVKKSDNSKGGNKHKHEPMMTITGPMLTTALEAIKADPDNIGALYKGVSKSDFKQMLLKALKTDLTSENDKENANKLAGFITKWIDDNDNSLIDLNELEHAIKDERQIKILAQVCKYLHVHGKAVPDKKKAAPKK